MSASFPRLSRLANARSSFISEGRGDADMHSLVDKWMDATKTYNFEGQRGERNFEKLVGVLGYGSLSDFLADNSGAFEALIGFVTSQDNPEWISAMEEVVGEEGDE